MLKNKQVISDMILSYQCNIVNMVCYFFVDLLNEQFICIFSFREARNSSFHPLYDGDFTLMDELWQAALRIPAGAARDRERGKIHRLTLFAMGLRCLHTGSACGAMR